MGARVRAKELEEARKAFHIATMQMARWWLALSSGIVFLSACVRSPHPEIREGDNIIYLRFAQQDGWWEEKCDRCGQWHREEFPDTDDREMKEEQLTSAKAKVLGNTSQYFEFEIDILGKHQFRVPWEFIEEIKAEPPGL